MIVRYALSLTPAPVKAIIIAIGFAIGSGASVILDSVAIAPRPEPRIERVSRPDGFRRQDMIIGIGDPIADIRLHWHARHAYERNQP